MVQAYYNSALRFLSPGCLTGPIFGKELRVSSRRRRNYLLRAAYLAMLIVFLVLFWLAEVPRGSSGLSRVSRMAEAGKNITAFIIWFQFIATQMVAAVMLCTAISDEIRHRTLGLLMTTPINSFQVVIGKLASKLLQLLLLLAISLPLLAIVRVFGGVPWMFVVSSLCITLTALVFVGSLSLFFSMLCSRAYVVLILVAITYGGLFFLLPWLSGWLCHVLTGRWPGPRLTTAIFYADPPVALMFNTELLSRGRTPGGFAMMSWPVHCAILLAVSGLILAVCIRVVRRIALRQAVGGSGPSSPPGTADVPATAESGPVRPVTGPPVLWKELRSPMITRRKKVVLGLALLVLFVTYALCAAEDILDHVDTHMMDVVVFGGIGMLFTIILPATSITSEKESRCWPLLLTTALGDWEILFGKFVGALRRCLPAWSLLFGHVILFCLVGIIHPVAIALMALIVAGPVVLLTSTGLYFSARFRHTTAAVIANLALAGVIWGLVPIVMALLTEIVPVDRDLLRVCLATNPAVQGLVAIEEGVSARGLFYWPGRPLTVAQSLGLVLGCMFGYIVVALVFAWRAKSRLRRNIF